MNENQKKAFEAAQHYEASWWIHHFTHELAPPSRDWLVGYQDHVGRGHMARMGLNQENRFWSCEPPAIQGSILDLGSSIVSFFEGKTMPVIAIEPTLAKMQGAFPELAIIGQSRNVQYIAGEIYKVENQCVDNVWCCNMLDHTPDWGEILSVQIPRVLKNGGKLYLSVDCRRGNVKLDAGHLTAFTPSMLRRVLDLNFKEIWSTKHIPDVDYWRWDYIGVLK